MAESNRTPEQQQLLVEIEVATKGLAASEGAEQGDYALAQGQELIEKAAKLGLPEESYAELAKGVAARTARTGG